MAFNLFKAKRKTEYWLDDNSLTKNPVGPGAYDPGNFHMSRSSGTAPFTTMQDRFSKIILPLQDLGIMEFLIQLLLVMLLTQSSALLNLLLIRLPHWPLPSLLLIFIILDQGVRSNWRVGIVVKRRTNQEKVHRSEEGAACQRISQKVNIAGKRKYKNCNTGKQFNNTGPAGYDETAKNKLKCSNIWESKSIKRIKWSWKVCWPRTIWFSGTGSFKIGIGM